jgi:hypothetical protein
MIAGSTIRYGGRPVVGFGQAEVVAPAAIGPSPWTMALATGALSVATGWALEEIRDKIRGRPGR